MVSSESGKPVTKLVTQERWEKVRDKIRWIGKQIGVTDEFTPSLFKSIQVEYTSGSTDLIHFKTTERLVGFIVYVCQTYTALIPYLKGIYLTLNSWRNGRDKEGWLTAEACLAARKGENQKDGNPPDWVKVISRLEIDIKALMKLTCYEAPPDIPIHASNPNPVYIVSDASGSGFGTCLVIQGNDVIYTEFGKWTKEVTEQRSSNFCESSNLLIRLKNLLQDGKIERGSEVFIVMDNAVAESTFFKGSSKSSSLHDLIVELQRLEMEGDLIVRLVWISGKRMIKIGVDGLSCGDFSSGVMAGDKLLKHLPFNESALDRCPFVLDHITSWVPDPQAWNVAIPEFWF